MVATAYPTYYPAYPPSYPAPRQAYPAFPPSGYPTFPAPNPITPNYPPVTPPLPAAPRQEAPKPAPVDPLVTRRLETMEQSNRLTQQELQDSQRQVQLLEKRLTQLSMELKSQPAPMPENSVNQTPRSFWQKVGDGIKNAWKWWLAAMAAQLALAVIITGDILKAVQLPGRTAEISQELLAKPTLTKGCAGLGLSLLTPLLAGLTTLHFHEGFINRNPG